VRCTIPPRSTVRISTASGQAIEAWVAQDDTMAPTGPALRVAEKAPRAALYRGRGGHYDVYEGGKDHDYVLRTEVEFLHRHLGPSRPQLSRFGG
jgi:hypothetical protein